MNLFDVLDDNVQLNIPIKDWERHHTTIADEYIENNTKHEAIVYQSMEYTPLNIVDKPPAKVYPFELDTFQKIAIAAIEADRSILVSAHTSCGKTVVAEYAIAKSIQNNQRVIYTSPIKALSNQKFRELQEEFEDVGLMTGDVTLNPEATCLVMTTEILRNMMYRESEIIKEIHWIIFDEIHYLKDRERGVVWEETLILAKNYVRMIFLSATIPNAREFAEWICTIHKQIVHVVYTEKRIIPLKHYFFSDKQYLIKNKDEKLSMNNFNASQKLIFKGKKETVKGLLACLNSVNLPAVVFSFARVKCEQFAKSIIKSYLTKDEYKLAQMIFNNAIQSLSDEDQNLIAVTTMKELFLKGIGVHHSGLLPIVKEIGEILFQEGLIKILFATESFSIGLNMPAKTVIFTSLKKFDGHEERILTSGEYCQMSGRAGRRGLDKEGIIVSLCSEKISIGEVTQMFHSACDPLISAFRLTYNMILNLMRVEESDPRNFLSKSFYHYQTYNKALKLKENFIRSHYIKPYDQHNDIYQLVEQLIQLYYQRSKQLQEKGKSILNSTNRVVSLLIQYPGSFIIIDTAILIEYKPHTLSCIIMTKSDNPSEEIVRMDFDNAQIIKIYNKQVKIKKESFINSYPEIHFPTNYDSQIEATIHAITAKNILVGQMIQDKRCLMCGRTLYEGCKINRDNCLKYYNGIDKTAPNPPCDYETEHINYLHQLLESKYKVSSKTLHEYLNYNKYLIYLYQKKIEDQKLAEFDQLKQIYHMTECKKMINVLRDLDYLDGNTVLLKGKMASEISSADEILLTEMIFNSTFNSLDIKDIIALISILITEKSKEGDDIILSEANLKLKELFTTSINKIIKVMQRHGIETDHDKYIQNYSYYMMDIVKLWMSGATFNEICSMTKIFEGSIIRNFKRLEELLRQLTSAATVIGNTEMINLFGQGIYLIKRDIVFANSLYL